MADTFDVTKSYEQVFYNEKRNLLDSELNENSAIQLDTMAHTYGLLVGAAFSGDAFKVVASGLNNNFFVNKGTFFTCEGKAVRLHSHITPSGISTPFGGDRTDVVYAEWFVEDIDSADDPDIIDAAVGKETATRKKLNVTIKLRQGSSEPLVTAGRNYFTIAILNRLENNPQVTAAMVEDTRTKTMNSFVVDNLKVNSGSGLSVDVAVGQALIGNVNHFLEATQNVSLAPTASSFVYWKEDGTFLATTTEYTGFAILLASVITGASSVSSVVDERKHKPIRLDVTEPPTQIVLTDSVTKEFTAGEAVAQYELVYAAPTAANSCKKADATSSATAPAIAIARVAVGSGQKDIFITQGELTNTAWSWTTGADLFLSETAGAISQSIPTAEGTIVQKIGIALSAEKISFNPDLFTVEN